MQRWQCPIHNGMLKSYLIKYELDKRYACFCFFKLFLFICGGFFLVRSNGEIHINRHFSSFSPFLIRLKFQGYRVVNQALISLHEGFTQIYTNSPFKDLFHCSLILHYNCLSVLFFILGLLNV